MIRKGTMIDGRKVTGFACTCGHEKEAHKDREILGERTKTDNKYEISFTIEENMGTCSVDKCWCHGFDPTSPVLEDGTILTWKDYFRCEGCKKYCLVTERIQYNESVCERCANEVFSKKLKAVNQFTEKMNDLKSLMGTKYSEILTNYIYVENEDYECPSTGICVKDVFDKIVENLEKEKVRLKKLIQEIER